MVKMGIGEFLKKKKGLADFSSSEKHLSHNQLM